MYCCVPGVVDGGGVAVGSRPRSERWVGVRGISVISSGVLMSGERAVRML